MGAGIIIAGESNIGLARKRNEDSFVLASLPGRSTALAAVADGIGGHRGGDIASGNCCAYLGGGYLEVVRRLQRPEDAAEFFRDTLGKVNAELYRSSCEAHFALPMASTLIGAIFFTGKLVLVSSGDSHCYEYLPSTGLRQLNTDHVAPPEVLAARQKDGKPAPSPLIHAIGLHEELEIDVSVIARRAESRYLFCSDGLHRGVSEKNLQEVLAASETPREAVDELMRQALMAGGRDNITIVVAFPEKKPR